MGFSLEWHWYRRGGIAGGTDKSDINSANTPSSDSADENAASKQSSKSSAKKVASINDETSTPTEDEE
nr:hypothetical protein [uncultured Prevotella sp.]